MKECVSEGMKIMCVVFLSMAFMLVGRAETQGLESVKTQAELEQAMASLDAALVEAYNLADPKKLSAFFDEGVESESGISPTELRRAIAPGKLQAIPLKGYGAGELGEHDFIHPKARAVDGESHFMHVWAYKDGAWKITRAAGDSNL